MAHEPITPGRHKAPRHWIPLYLAMLATRGDCPAAYSGGYTTPEKVAAARRQSGYFDAAVRIILREQRKGTPLVALAGKLQQTRGSVSEVDFCAHVGTQHAKEVIMHADSNALLSLCQRLAAAVGLETIEGLAVIPWFNRERRVQLEREVLAIGDTDPEFAAHIQRELDKLRALTGPDSIVQPLED